MRVHTKSRKIINLKLHLLKRSIHIVMRSRFHILDQYFSLADGVTSVKSCQLLEEKKMVCFIPVSCVPPPLVARSILLFLLFLLLPCKAYLEQNPLKVDEVMGWQCFDQAIARKNLFKCIQKNNNSASKQPLPQGALASIQRC